MSDENLDKQEDCKPFTSPGFKGKERMRKLTSTVWNNFTVIDRDQKVAICDLCGTNMSYRSTVTNMRKHLIRKHHMDRKDTFFRPNQANKETAKRTIITPRKKTLTELSGLDGILLNVVGEDGEDLLDDEGTPQEVEEETVLYTTNGEGHDYCVTESEPGQSEYSGNSAQRERRDIKPRMFGAHSQTRFSDSQASEKVKKNRIMDLQLECLEIKKYTMQMEALMLEHQLNLPRSVFTETLEESSSMSRGTQTDIGGNNTKVFYVSDTEGSRNSQHFFKFQTRLDK